VAYKPSFDSCNGIGNRDEALVWLQKAYTEQSNLIASLKVQPVFDPLWSEARFSPRPQR